MSQSNAAREPSMEEILASIRRIIETTDGSEDGLNDFDMQDDTGEDAEEESPTLARVRDEVANSQTTHTTAEREPSSGSREQTAQAADTASSPRPGLSPRYGENARYASSTATSGAAADADSRNSHVSLAEVAARASTPPPADREKKEPGPAGSAGVTERPSYTASRPPQTTQDKPKAGRAEPEKTPDKLTLGDAMRANALVSTETGNRVAASFEHLNQAVVTGPTRSFDDIAQEMLRPMLQEWLDNNLPVLVERLVREEIERIAKGR